MLPSPPARGRTGRHQHRGYAPSVPLSPTTNNNSVPRGRAGFMHARAAPLSGSDAGVRPPPSTDDDTKNNKTVTASNEMTATTTLNHASHNNNNQQEPSGAVPQRVRSQLLPRTPSFVPPTALTGRTSSWSLRSEQDDQAKPLAAPAAVTFEALPPRSPAPRTPGRPPLGISPSAAAFARTSVPSIATVASHPPSSVGGDPLSLFDERSDDDNDADGDDETGARLAPSLFAMLPTAALPLTVAYGSASEETDHMLYSVTCAVDHDEDTGDVARVNDFEMFHAVGSGAYGTVYAAECPRYDGLLAVKALPRRKAERAADGPRSVDAFDGATPRGLDASPRSPDATPMTVDLVHEADVMSRLRHENIVKIHEAIDDPVRDTVFLVMEFVDGNPAGNVTETDDESGFICTTLPEREQRLVARGVASALHYCQQQKVVHGDVKPENVLLEHGPRTGGSSRAVARAKLADFGVAVTMGGGGWRFPDIATPPATFTVPAPFESPPAEMHFASPDQPELIVDSSNIGVGQATGCPSPAASLAATPVRDEPALLTVADSVGVRRSSSLSPRAKRAVRGTPAFLAPELVDGTAPHPTPASDAWALGVTLFGLRYGYLPFGGATRQRLAASIENDDPKFPRIDARPGTAAWREERRWRAVLRRLLEKEPAARMTAHALLHCSLFADESSI